MRQLNRARFGLMLVLTLLLRLGGEAQTVRGKEFRYWLQGQGIKTLNVAGNRESEMPGITEFTREFLVSARSKAAIW